MHLSTDQLRALLGPLNPSRVASRKQGGRNLSYLQAWDVRATLIRVFGFGGFSIDVLDSKVLSVERDVPKAGAAGERGETNPFRFTIQATVRLTIHDPEGTRDVTYTETAVSSQTGPDPGEVADFAAKTAVSDALKRCAINLGTQFGLSLYAGTTTDIVRVVLAEGQTAGDLAQIPAGTEGVQVDPADVDPRFDAEHQEQAEEQIARATTGAVTRARESK